MEPFSFLISIAGGISISFQMIASLFALFLWIPPILDVFKLNKTYGLSEKFVLFGIVAGVVFVISGICGVVEGSLESTPNVIKIAFNAISLCLNTFSGTVNFLFLGRKRIHMRASEEKGLSEMDYYDTYLAK